MRDAPFTNELIDLIPQYLSGCEELFWDTAVIAPYDAKYSDYDIKGVVQTLLMYHRAAAAIDALGYDIKSANIEDSLLCTILLEAPLDKSFGSVRQYSVCRIIKHLQDSDSVDIDTLCGIEYIYLPWLDRHSPTQPRAIRYKSANDADYFYELMKTTYKERHQDTIKKSVPHAVSERLFQLTFQYSIVPGIDREGNFQPAIFMKIELAGVFWTVISGLPKMLSPLLYVVKLSETVAAQRLNDPTQSEQVVVSCSD